LLIKKNSYIFIIFLSLLGLNGFIFYSGDVFGATATDQQLEIFKNLSTKEQNDIAKQLGINLSRGTYTQSDRQIMENPETVSPRERNAEYFRGNNKQEDGGGEKSKTIDGLKQREKEKNTGEESLKPYGYDLFAGSPSTFAPVSDIPVPSDYVVGPGDVVVLQLYGKENVKREIVVTREGLLQIPEIGPVTVVGLSYRELKEHLNKLISKKMIGVNISITMGSLRSIRIFVLGEAYRPGSYTVSSLSTIINALFFSGGVTDLGSLRHIQLKRRGNLIGELDLYDLLLKGDTSADARLLPGDVIFIPTIGKTVGVSGEVKRPAIYELKHERNAKQVLELAGGLLATAYPGISRIERINSEGERTLIDVDLKTVKGQMTLVSDTDILKVYSISDTYEKVVTLKGHVKRPGGFALRSELRVSDIISSQYDLLPMADLEYALIVRESQPSRAITFSSFNVGNAIAKPRSETDPLLENRDEVIIFDGSKGNRQEILRPYLENILLQARLDRPAKLVSVSGSVRFPGTYPFTENMAVTDLILASGGLSESAYKLSAEITRSKKVQSQYQEYERIEIELESSEKIALRTKDQLFIKKTPNWEEKKTVTIQGEVVFPGKYPIFKGDTIVKLLDRAGGFTAYADPQAAIFLRQDLKKRELEQLDRYKIRLERDVAELKFEEKTDNTNTKGTRDEEQAVANNLLSRITETKAAGRLVIDLPKIIIGGSIKNIELKDKDILVIPPHSLGVSVLGEIQFPVSHVYKKGENVFDYIRNSGGYTSKSDKKRIFIVKPNGSVVSVGRYWFIRTNTGIDPGDTVVVPYNTYSVSSMAHWTNVSTMLFQLASVAASLKTLGAL